MTRGTAILLMKNYIMSSIQFNGDMYPDGYGDEFLEGLSEVKDDTDFDIFIHEFNDFNFQYDNEEVTFAHPNETLYNKNGIIDLINSSSKLNSDWLFFKNLTGKLIQFRIKRKGNVEIMAILPDETIRFNYNEFPYVGKHSIQ